ncbi:hypothetical protein H8D30_02955 [bacterium]|nr:hypothetical protein [bacterium]
MRSWVAVALLVAGCLRVGSAPEGDRPEPLLDHEVPWACVSQDFAEHRLLLLMGREWVWAGRPGSLGDLFSGLGALATEEAGEGSCLKESGQTLLIRSIGDPAQSTLYEWDPREMPEEAAFPYTRVAKKDWSAVMWFRAVSRLVFGGLPYADPPVADCSPPPVPHIDGYRIASDPTEEGCLLSLWRGEELIHRIALEVTKIRKDFLSVWPPRD